VRRSRGGRTAIEQVRRGEVRASRETFAEFWATVLEAKRPYVTAGTLQDYATQGRKRLLPWEALRRGQLAQPTTTEEHYGHLETSFVREAAARTEALIASARL
jgi:hypothetical protein